MSDDGMTTVIVQNPKPLKVQAPEVFEGKVGILDKFMIQLRLYYGFHPDQFTADIDKILFACSYMRGVAFAWAEGYLTDYLEHPGTHNAARSDETNRFFQNFAGYETRLKTMFGDPNKVLVAERRLQEMRQTTSVSAYTAEFRKYQTKVEWDDTALLSQFYRGLKDTVKDDIVRSDRPTTLQTIIDLAIKIDNRHLE